ncbi:medium-chain acyl-CoA ligase ACSF2, mitochondrial-like [Watersipora subatra]|uniref:medium-chain acyl-CoA ligase ACSF2, mitochondrial-like n=1 Tax=Watersipora subatra TaxID=2589382 RepID=UPI00355B2011
MLVKSYYHDTRYPLCPYTLPELWEKAALRDAGNKVTWVDPFEEMGQKELYNQAMQVAKGLMALGMKRGDTLCCFGSRGSDPAIMFIACSSLGIIYMCNHLYAPVDQLMQKIISKVKPTAVLIGEIPCDETPFSSHFVRSSQSVTDHKISHVIFDRKAEKLDGYSKSSDWRSLSSVMAEGVKTISDELLASSKSKVEKREPCLYSLSSGSTGDIKLVLLSGATFAKIDKTKPEFKVLGLPDAATEEITLCAQLVESRFVNRDLVVFPYGGRREEKTIVSELLQAIETYRVTGFYTDQYYIMKIVNIPEYREGFDLSSLCCIITAGNIVSLEFKRRMLKIASLSIDIYGSTEFFSTVAAEGGSLLLRPTSVGQPYPNTEAKVVDENGDIVPVNVRGQLLLRGPFLFLEYKDQPELTAAAKTADGWFKTGDLVSMDEAGYLYIYGRMANSLRWKVAGDVVYSCSIESILRTHPSIKTCLVAGTKAEVSLEHEINYVIEAVPDSGLTPEDIKNFAMEKMNTRLEWPIRIFMYEHDELPYTSGSRRKLNRKALQEQIEARVAANPKENLVWDEEVYSGSYS